ncbi:MAG: aspartate/methionine/tyrosine aminotransferase [Myxococcota bacterium]|jgi:aspartate/methionine/tyrosine aminotransferase
MSDASRLNQILSRDLPAAARALSPLGRAAAFPRGIPFQAAQAKSAAINATIGQLTTGAGAPMPLPQLARLVPELDPADVFLYAPVSGPVALRKAWIARQRALAGNPDVHTSLPIVLHGLTHGISVLAALFADEETDIIVPSPHWENYELLFSLHARARIVSYPFFRERRFNVEGLADRLQATQGRKAIVLLNFPSNPTGYQPRADEVDGIVDVLCAHTGVSVVVSDDAYQGFVYEPGRAQRSLFWDLAERSDPERLLPVKVDGATKELLFFGSRIAFLTHTGSADACAALESKLKYVVRGTVGAVSGPAAAMVHAALQSPTLDDEFAIRRDELARRYRALKRGLATLPSTLVPYPFNSAFFAMVGLPSELDAEAARTILLEDASLGVISLPESHALRIAYCSLDVDQIPDMVARLATIG